jgi:hypothetical protein
MVKQYFVPYQLLYIQGEIHPATKNRYIKVFIDVRFQRAARKSMLAFIYLLQTNNTPNKITKGQSAHSKTGHTKAFRQISTVPPDRVVVLYEMPNNDDVWRTGV